MPTGRCQEEFLAEIRLADECRVRLEENVEIEQRTFDAHPLSSTMPWTILPPHAAEKKMNRGATHLTLGS